jgi:hypothetical protein
MALLRRRQEGKVCALERRSITALTTTTRTGGNDARKSVPAAPICSPTGLARSGARALFRPHMLRASDIDEMIAAGATSTNNDRRTCVLFFHRRYG